MNLPVPKTGMTLLFGTGSLYERKSGPHHALVETAHRLAQLGHRVLCVGSKDRWSQGAPEDFAELETHAFAKLGPRSLHFTPALPFWLHRSQLKPDAASFEAVWLWNAPVLAAWCRRRGVPYLINVNGNFSPLMLRKHRFRKRLARHAFVDRMLAGAYCFRASSQAELSHIREFGICQAVALIPNGITIPKQIPRSEARTALKADVPNDRICLFLGRLDPIKGLDILIDAWARLGDLARNWTLVVIGDGPTGYRDFLQARARDRGLTEAIVWTGYCEPNEKLLWFGAADLFVLPSRSEGFAVAPLEAMSYGLPTILTTACNFPEAATAGAAITAECTIEGLTVALSEAFQLSPATLSSMAERARDLIKTRYSIDRTCADLEAVFRWMASGGPMPSCIVGA